MARPKPALPVTWFRAYRATHFIKRFCAFKRNIFQHNNRGSSIPAAPFSSGWKRSPRDRPQHSSQLGNGDEASRLVSVGYRVVLRTDDRDRNSSGVGRSKGSSLGRAEVEDRSGGGKREDEDLYLRRWRLSGPEEGRPS